MVQRTNLLKILAPYIAVLFLLFCASNSVRSTMAWARRVASITERIISTELKACSTLSPSVRVWVAIYKDKNLQNHGDELYMAVMSLSSQ